MGRQMIENGNADCLILRSDVLMNVLDAEASAEMISHFAGWFTELGQVNFDSSQYR